MGQQPSPAKNHLFDNPKSLAYRTTLIATPLLISLAAIANIHFSAPMPDYWFDANQLVTTGHIAQRFEPSGYAGFIALGIRLCVAHPEFGVEIMQALLEVLIVLMAWALMRRLGATPAVALLGAGLVALHPELVVTITKVWDVSLSTALLLSLALPSVVLMQEGFTWSRLILTGVVLGAGCFDRPNYLLLLLPVSFVLWHVGRGLSSSLLTTLGRGAVVLSAAAAVYISLSFAVYGSFVLPGNGPYNLYVGQNRFSEQALLHNLNAEPSLSSALRADPNAPGLPWHSDEMKPYYTRASILFARHNLVEEGRLVAVKLYTFLRADTKLHKITSLDGIIKLLLTLPIPIWLAGVFWLRLSGVRWTPPDIFIFVIAILYVVPFLITNSDPRFRTPLDILVFISSVGLFSRYTLSQSSVPIHVLPEGAD